MDCLTHETHGHVALITLNRPEAHNSMSPELVVRLDEALRTARDDDTIRCIVLAAAGDKSFCAGGDLKLMIPLITGARKPSSDYDFKLLELLKTSGRPLPVYGPVNKPVIAAIEGAALGGGLELALACDMIVSGTDATFGAPEVAAGAYPARITYLLPKRIPYSVAVDVLLSCRKLTSSEALQHGLVSRLVAAGDALSEALALAKSIAENAPVSVQSALAVAQACQSAGEEDIIKLDRRMSKGVYATKDAREGPRAFAEKRKPVFEGR